MSKTESNNSIAYAARKRGKKDLKTFAERAAESWFVCKEYSKKQLVRDILECMEVLEKFLQYWGFKEFFVPMLIYVDRYIEQVGKLGPVHIFDLFFVSTVVTVKFWEDKRITNSTFSKMFSMPTQELNINERNFLTAVDYDLSLTIDQVNQFLCNDNNSGSVVCSCS